MKSGIIVNQYFQFYNRSSEFREIKVPMENNISAFNSIIDLRMRLQQTA